MLLIILSLIILLPIRDLTVDVPPGAGRIERSRTVLPSLVTAARRAGRRRVNWRYFHRLLFTTDNLRLVHIVCHDKSSHELLTCDKSQLYER